ncbi:hypothetical protein [Luteibaculum oceani]|uniref:DUF4870 domain-containing protein n=1 Tax=Luteibaculum oceani TaxID=1294296 RepID=A0A5C6V037_9FLAO|nr:hypothetical protein [Luteibaculum oceani]TXC78519.1 hypothetical protein FRX97_07310 [Luteibaculum oceani]
MADRLSAALAYLTVIGWVISLLIHKSRPKYFINFHLKNALFLHGTAFAMSFLMRFANSLGILLSLIGLAMMVYYVIGLINALMGSEQPLPFIGNWIQEKLPNF